MKALVTGADGFVGPYLIGELLSQGYTAVGTYNAQPSSYIEGVEYHSMDILKPDEISSVFEEEQPDVIFHLAAISDVRFSIDHAQLTKKVNEEGTKNILDAALGLEKKPTVLVIGSAHVYGIPQKVPISEDHPLHADTPYAESKIAAERLAAEYTKKGLKVVVARSFNHIGPGQTENFVTSAFAKQIAEIEGGADPIMKVGDLSAKRDFTDVRDIVRAYVLAVQKCDGGTPYNICSRNAFSMQEILDKLLSLSKVKVSVEQDPARMRPSDIPLLQGDASLFCSKTGWKPAIDLDKSLSDILDYWRERI